MKREAVVALIREMVFIGFFVMIVLNFVSTSKVEDRVLLVIIEMVFVATKMYCKMQLEKRNNQKKFNNIKKGEKKEDRS